MQGALLRSGDVSQFSALGVEGQPVYSAALQIREALRIKLGLSQANFLAIPQLNESRDKVDWYAPQKGDVVPWYTATEQEQQQALKKLDQFHLKLQQVAQKMQQSTNTEHQLFGKMLEKTLRFPSKDCVYLVNNQPVISFWGFSNKEVKSLTPDPLLLLRPEVKSSLQESVPVQEIIPPEPAIPPAIETPILVDRPKRSWWKWLLWLLLLLFLIFLLLFLLRGCVPSITLPFGLGNFALPNLSLNEPEGKVELPNTHLKEEGTDIVVGGNTIRPNIQGKDTVGNIVSLSDKQAQANTSQEVQPVKSPEHENPNEYQPQNESLASAEDKENQKQGDENSIAPLDKSTDQVPLSPQSNENDQAMLPPPELPTGENSKPAQSLNIPSDAKAQGTTKFLQGNWRAPMGIQDSKTGKPLQLDYQFKSDGSGEVVVQNSSGSRCQSPVKANLNNGKLEVDSQGKAVCADGSSYDIPPVRCESGDNGKTNCFAQDQNKHSFPFSMYKSAH